MSLCNDVMNNEKWGQVWAARRGIEEITRHEKALLVLKSVYTKRFRDGKFDFLTRDKASGTFGSTRTGPENKLDTMSTKSGKLGGVLKTTG